MASSGPIESQIPKLECQEIARWWASEPQGIPFERGRKGERLNLKALVLQDGLADKQSARRPRPEYWAGVMVDHNCSVEDGFNSDDGCNFKLNRSLG